MVTDKESTNSKDIVKMWHFKNFYCCENITVVFVGFIIYQFIKLLRGFLNTKSITDSIKSYKIIEICNVEDCKKACNLLNSHCKDLSALGFDCEWVTTEKRHPVALLQLASVHGLCCLFRLNILNHIPSDLQDILTNHNILKLGVSPAADSKLLLQDYGVKAWFTLDLRYLYPTCGGLASLTSTVLGIQLEKNYKIQCSDWEGPELTELQKNYAAKDAFVAIEIFKKWLSQNSAQQFQKAQIPHRELFQFILDKGVSIHLQVDFNQKLTKNKSAQSVTVNATEPNNEISNKKSKQSIMTRKSPLYHNCFMHAPDGELLCSCDRKKADWYLEKGLAEILPGEPFAIKLLFEPAARATDSNGGRYYQQLKQNHCVVCGADKSYLKHNVVPREYRKYFPKIMKNHQSHDIVLMCINCHKLATEFSNAFKKELEILCDAPITTKITHEKSIIRIKNFAKALLNQVNQIPQERKLYLESEIKKYFNVTDLTKDCLEKAILLDSFDSTRNLESHGEKVINYFLKKSNGLILLEKMWREYFLKTMKPQYLPALWSVTHNHSRLNALQKDMTEINYFDS